MFHPILFYDLFPYIDYLWNNNARLPIMYSVHIRIKKDIDQFVNIILIIICGRCNLKRSRRTVIFLPVYKISSLKITLPKTLQLKTLDFLQQTITMNENAQWQMIRDRLKMWQFFSNEVSFIWLRPPTHPLQMKVWKKEYRCIINQTPPKNIGFGTMHSPYACHDKGSIYESLSFENHRHLISSKCTYNSTSILYQ